MSAIAGQSQVRRGEVREGGGWRRTWRRVWLMGKIVYQQVDHDRTFTQAAALTYETLFSLLPVFVLSLLVLSMISAGGGQNALDAQLKHVIFEEMQLNHLALTDDSGHELKDTGGKPVYLSSVAERLIEKAKASVTDTATTVTGLVALGILLYGAISLMVVIEGTFNQIYGSARPRSWPRSILLYWCALTLGPIGIAASLTLGHQAFAAADSIAGAGWILSAINVITGFCVSWLLIMVMYRLIPDTHVNWHSAALGSFVAALLWEIGKWGFGIYVDRSLRTTVYGSLAIIPLFMLWIYLTWSVVLTGLEISYVEQYWVLLKRRYYFARTARGGRPLSDARWVLPLGVLLYRQFRDGKATRAHDAAELLMLPNHVAEHLLEGLAAAGVVHVSRGGAYVLARPPEQITAHDLLIAARAMCEAPPELAKDQHKTDPTAQSRALADLDELESRWAKSHTLPSLAGEAETRIHGTETRSHEATK